MQQRKLNLKRNTDSKWQVDSGFFRHKTVTEAVLLEPNINKSPCIKTKQLETKMLKGTIKSED
jgi:hypothetical protein